MKDQITIIATLKLLNNNLPELTAAVKELQAHCLKTEEGMLTYDWYILENSDSIKVLETYTNSEAVLYHFDNCKPFAPRLSQSRAMVSMEVYGKASDPLRERVKKIKAQHFTPISYLDKVK